MKMTPATVIGGALLLLATIVTIIVVPRPELFEKPVSKSNLRTNPRLYLI